MTGFIRGLFGGGNKGPEESKEAFFLDDDSAKSLGDLDYMRNPSKVRRTFPKSVSSPEKKEYVQETSAMDKVYVSSEGSIPLAGGVKPKVAGGGQIKPKTIANTSFSPTASAAPAPAPAPAAPAPAASESAPAPAPAPAPTFTPKPADTAKRTADSGMDMFRNMAKNMPR